MQLKYLFNFNFRYKKKNISPNKYLKCQKCQQLVHKKNIFYSSNKILYCDECIKNIGLIKYHSSCNYCSRNLFNSNDNLNCFDSVTFLSFDRNLNILSLCSDCFNIEYNNYNQIDSQIAKIDINKILNT